MISTLTSLLLLFLGRVATGPLLAVLVAIVISVLFVVSRTFLFLFWLLLIGRGFLGGLRPSFRSCSLLFVLLFLFLFFVLIRVKVNDTYCIGGCGCSTLVFITTVLFFVSKLFLFGQLLCFLLS
jgi:hypothetical protein